MNASPSWAFSDDITELYFESEDHLNRVFQSSWVREKVGPDGANFSDLGASLPVTVQETPVPLHGCASPEDNDPLSVSLVAMYFISGAADHFRSNELVSGFAESLQRLASNQVRALVANIPVDLSFDADSYFGSRAGRPRFDLVLAIHLRSKEGVPAVRRAQDDFEVAYESHLNLESCWIAFGRRALLFDQDLGIKVCSENSTISDACAHIMNTV